MTALSEAARELADAVEAFQRPLVFSSPSDMAKQVVQDDARVRRALAAYRAAEQKEKQA